MLKVLVRGMVLLLAVCLGSVLVALGVGRARNGHIIVAAEAGPDLNVSFSLFDVDRGLSWMTVDPLPGREVVFSPNGQLALIGYASTDAPTVETFQVYDLRTLERFAIDVPMNPPRIWSPDSRRIVSLDTANNLQVTDVIDQTTRSITAYDRLPVSDLNWSPDGQSIAFIVDGTVQIVDVHSGDVRGVTRNMTVSGERESSDLAWSPDGHCLAYHTRNAQNIATLQIIDLDRQGNCDTTLAVPQDWYLPQWSPDGRWLTFFSNPDGQEDVHTFDRASKQLYQLTGMDSYTGVPWLTWSPDSTQMMVEFADGSASTVYLTDPTGAEIVVLAENASVPQWSPQGTYIVYQSREVVSGETRTRLHILDADTIEAIGQITGGNVVQVLWAEDDSLLGLIYSPHPGMEQLTVFDPENRVFEPLSGPGAFIFSFAYWE